MSHLHKPVNRIFESEVGTIAPITTDLNVVEPDEDEDHGNQTKETLIKHWEEKEDEYSSDFWFVNVAEKLIEDILCAKRRPWSF